MLIPSHPEKAAGEADRLQEELDTLHREMDQAEKEHAHEIEDLLEAEKRLRRELHEKDHMLHSADEETAAVGCSVVQHTHYSCYPSPG